MFSRNELKFNTILSFKYIGILKKQFKFTNLDLNIHHRNENVTTNTIYSNTSAIDSVVKQYKLFVGCYTMFTDVYPLKTVWNAYKID